MGNYGIKPTATNLSLAVKRDKGYWLPQPRSEARHYNDGETVRSDAPRARSKKLGRIRPNNLFYFLHHGDVLVTH